MRKFALIMAIALAFVGLISYICTPSPVTSPQSWERHYVSEGDTLWDIATAIPHKGVKLNDVIDDAKRLKAELEQIRQNLVDCNAPDGLLAQVDSSLAHAGHIGKYLESKGVFHD